MNRFQKKLTLVFCLYGFIFFSLLFGLNKIISLYLLNNFHSRIESLALNVKTNIANSLTLDDIYSVKMFLHSLIDDKDITSAAVYSPSGEEYALASKPGESSAATRKDIPVIILGEDFGTLSLFYSDKDILKRIRLTNLIINLTGLLLFCAVLITLILYPNAITEKINRAAGMSSAGIEQRRFYRIKVLLPATIEVGGTSSYTGTIRDISLGGASVSTDCALAEKQPLHIEFTWETEQFRLEAAVVRKTGEGQHLYGIEFTDINLLDRARISPLLQAHRTD